MLASVSSLKYAMSMGNKNLLWLLLLYRIEGSEVWVRDNPSLLFKNKEDVGCTNKDTAARRNLRLVN